MHEENARRLQFRTAITVTRYFWAVQKSCEVLFGALLLKHVKLDDFAELEKNDCCLNVLFEQNKKLGTKFFFFVFWRAGGQ